MIVVETTLAVGLLVGAGLLLRDLARTEAVDLGLDTESTVTASITPSSVRFESPGALDDAVVRILEGVARDPHVRAVGVIGDLPLSGAIGTGWVERPDRPVEEGVAPPAALYRTVAGEYFRAAGIPLVAGRMLDGRDASEAPPTALVNEELVRMLFPDDEPLGRTVPRDRRPGRPDPGPPRGPAGPEPGAAPRVIGSPARPSRPAPAVLGPGATRPVFRARAGMLRLR